MSSEERLEICKKCPLYEETEYGPKCSDRRYLNRNDTVSWIKRPGSIQGCGCYLKQKVLKTGAKCVAGKW